MALTLIFLMILQLSISQRNKLLLSILNLVVIILLLILQYLTNIFFMLKLLLMLLATLVLKLNGMKLIMKLNFSLKLKDHLRLMVLNKWNGKSLLKQMKKNLQNIGYKLGSELMLLEKQLILVLIQLQHIPLLMK